MLDTLDGQLLKHLHLLLFQRTGWSDHYRLARVDAQGIEVLHRCDGEAAVVGIADALKLYLLPALQRLFDENLRSKREGRLCQFDELLLVRADTRSESA